MLKQMKNIMFIQVFLNIKILFKVFLKEIKKKFNSKNFLYKNFISILKKIIFYF